MGSGEWLKQKHREKSRAKWLKVHVAVDALSQEVISISVTDEKGSDSKQLPGLLKQAPKSVREVIGDGAYDTRRCRECIAERGARALIPPKKGAKLAYRPYKGSDLRDEAIKAIFGLGGNEEVKKCWKALTRYGRRSLVKTFFSRYKSRFGCRLKSKTFDRQQVEIGIKARLFNRKLQGAA